jgi:hypothetical protein
MVAIYCDDAILLAKTIWKMLSSTNILLGADTMQWLIFGCKIIQLLTILVVISVYFSQITPHYVWWPAFESIRVTVAILSRLDQLIPNDRILFDERRAFRVIALTNVVGFLWVFPIYIIYISASLSTDEPSTVLFFTTLLFIVIQILTTLPAITKIVHDLTDDDSDGRSPYQYFLSEFNVNNNNNQSIHVANQSPNSLSQYRSHMQNSNIHHHIQSHLVFEEEINITDDDGAATDADAQDDHYSYYNNILNNHHNINRNKRNSDNSLIINHNQAINTDGDIDEEDIIDIIDGDNNDNIAEDEDEDEDSDPLLCTKPDAIIPMAMTMPIEDTFAVDHHHHHQVEKNADSSSTSPPIKNVNFLNTNTNATATATANTNHIRDPTLSLSPNKYSVLVTNNDDNNINNSNSNLNTSDPNENKNNKNNNNNNNLNLSSITDETRITTLVQKENENENEKETETEIKTQTLTENENENANNILVRFRLPNGENSLNHCFNGNHTISDLYKFIDSMKIVFSQNNNNNKNKNKNGSTSSSASASTSNEQLIVRPGHYLLCSDFPRCELYEMQLKLSESPMVIHANPKKNEDGKIVTSFVNIQLLSESDTREASPSDHETEEEQEQAEREQEEQKEKVQLNQASRDIITNCE